MLPADGGYQAVRFAGSGRDLVMLEYQPLGWSWYLKTTSGSAAALFLVPLASWARRASRRTGTAKTFMG